MGASASSRGKHVERKEKNENRGQADRVCRKHIVVKSPEMWYGVIQGVNYARHTTNQASS